ncbi:hypothetical protein [Niallia endozanthoxylica]|uniref:Uncharacterized protein n=1 Tax=Niallia endozanthoxylica TaxID=2036016 RepID=A0A5J5HX66_9BACI|nr:hypothetical protein [Niallia endozanthoxylica]KAA9025754.1 hypothetical protein F4V44_07650 [Niallia endozanthoxylica]
MAKAKTKDYLTTAPEEEKVTVENGSIFPNEKIVAGDSVDEHKRVEEANILIASNEIGQQNENL